MPENKTFREQFLSVTGLTYDIEEVIKNLSDEDKKEFKNNVKWHIPGGAYLKEGSSKKELVDEFLNSLDEALGTTSEGEGEETPDIPDNPKEEATEENLADGGDLEVTNELKTTKTIELKSDLNLTVNANINAKAAADFIKVSENNVTVVVEGDGKSVIESPLAQDNKDTGSSVFAVEADSNLKLSNVNVIGARAVLVNSKNATAEIESGEYDTFYGEAPSIYVGPKGGKITINGGTYGVKYNNKYYGGNKFLLNLYDSLLKGTDKKATDFIEVKGGEFIGFDPAKSESETPMVSFVPDGYESVKTRTVNGMVANTVTELDVYEVRPINA